MLFYKSRANFAILYFFFGFQNLHVCFLCMSTSAYNTEFEGRSTNELIKQKSVIIPVRIEVTLFTSMCFRAWNLGLLVEVSWRNVDR